MSFFTAGCWEKETDKCAHGSFFGPSYFEMALHNRANKISKENYNNLFFKGYMEHTIRMWGFQYWRCRGHWICCCNITGQYYSTTGWYWNKTFGKPWYKTISNFMQQHKHNNYRSIFMKVIQTFHHLSRKIIHMYELFQNSTFIDPVKCVLNNKCRICLQL